MAMNQIGERKLKIVNRHNYPDTIVQAITNDPYNKGDCEYSATGLIKPPRAARLAIDYDELIEVDVDSRMFALYGQIGHGLLERAGTAIGKSLIEKRLFGTVDGTRISAQIDSLSLEPDGTLIDWKFTTVYKFKKRAVPGDEWQFQMNIQLEMLRQNNLADAVKRMQIWGLLRDWRPGEQKREREGYPNKAAFHDIPMWTQEDTLKRIGEAIRAHKAALIDLPECTREENWSGVRCADYCDAAAFCQQYQKTKQRKVF